MAVQNQDNIKTLHERNLFDGTVRAINDNNDNNKLKYIEDSTPMDAFKAHKVFGYSGNTPQLDRNPPFNAPNEPFFSSILGFTSPSNGELVLISPLELQEYSSRAQHWSENIFPVLIRRKNGIDRPFKDPNARTWKEKKDSAGEYIRQIYGFGLYLVLLDKEVTERKRVWISINRDIEVNQLSAHLFLCKNWSKRHMTRIERIVDRNHTFNQNDYNVCGMFVSRDSLKKFDFFYSKLKVRHCFDLLSTDEGLYGPNRRYGFRTEISYEWRMRRIGYYCGLNSLLVVVEHFQEDPEKSMTSLLRDSTFIIGDGSHNYLNPINEFKSPVRDLSKSLPLGPMISVVTEGVSELFLNPTEGYPLLPYFVYNMTNGICRPLLLNWIEFENDFNPTEPTVGDPFVVSQHKLKQLMKFEEFCDFVVFRWSIQNQHIMTEMVCILAEQPNAMDNRWYCNWHFYAHIDASEYYFYLTTQTFCYKMSHGIFLQPVVIRGSCIPLFSETIDEIDHYNDPILTQNEQIRMNRWADIYNYWWQTYGHENAQNRDLYRSVHCVLTDVIQLRNPTVIGIMRAIKTQRFYIRRVPLNPDPSFHRPYFDRFRQVLRVRDMTDFHIIKGNDGQSYAFVMYDLPLPNIDYNNDIYYVIDYWDVYGRIGNGNSPENHVYHYLGTIRIDFQIDILGQYVNTEDSLIQYFDVIQTESRINQFWYFNEHNLAQVARVFENWWTNVTNRGRVIQSFVIYLHPHNIPPTNLFPMKRMSYFGFQRLEIFNDPFESSQRLPVLQRYKYGPHQGLNFPVIQI